MFIYQSFGWYWMADGLRLNIGRLKKGKGPILYIVTGDISSSDNELDNTVFVILGVWSGPELILPL
jgi:hypothetical protein